MKNTYHCHFDDDYIEPPTRVINVISGGNADLKEPYLIGFIVSSTRKQTDYLSVVARHNEYIDYLNNQREQATNEAAEEIV